MGTWAADGQVTGAAAQASISCRCKCGVFPTALYLKLGDRPHAHAHARVNVIKRKTHSMYGTSRTGKDNLAFRTMEWGHLSKSVGATMGSKVMLCAETCRARKLAWPGSEVVIQ